MSAPPFAALADYVSFLGQIVPDTKATTTNEDFVKAALQRLSEEVPCVEAVDVGDGSTLEWTLGSGDFGRWQAGFSERYEVTVERLVAGASSFNPSYLVEGGDWRLEHRSSSGAPTLTLRFAAAPSSTDKVRVRFSRHWRVTSGGSAVNEVPGNLQMALVYKAAELKCRALAAIYASTVDTGVASEVFVADPTHSRYLRQAGEFEEQYDQIVGVRKGLFTAGCVPPTTGRVFP